jgi:uncharacterized protein involved in exopolysaccharide biosynthesis
MQETKQITHADDEIDLRELFGAIAAGKLLIILITVICTVASFFYAKSLPNIYESEITLIPAGDNAGLKIPGQLGGLAALAGVDLGGKGGDKTSLALEILKSREFLGRFIEENDLYVPIMAAKGWDRASDTLIIDEQIYNEETKVWVREVAEPLNAKPSTLETIDELKTLFSTSQDKITGIVKLKVEYFSPILAKTWANKLVKNLNEEMRHRDLIEAEKSISYLNEQIKQTNLADMQTMLFSLIEEQMKTKMLANAREEYVLKTIDAAVVAELKSGPKRALIVLMALMLGVVISTMLVIVRFMLRKS